MTFEPIDWNDDDDQPATQQLRDADPYRHPAGRSCATTAALLGAFVALLTALARKGSAR